MIAPWPVMSARPIKSAKVRVGLGRVKTSVLGLLCRRSRGAVGKLGWFVAGLALSFVIHTLLARAIVG
jgi:hypothetical protein